MTEHNRRLNLADELARARQALGSAEALAGIEHYADAISRAYYAAYHAVRAVLLTRGLEPRSHAGALHLFNVEFVRGGELPATHNRLLTRLRRSREVADYDAAFAFGEPEATADLRAASEFVADVVAWLEREGWTEDAAE